MNLICPRCGSTVRIPMLWVLGVELVFLCPQCKRRFKTGYKMGAVLSALALTLALVSVNIGAFLLSSYSIPIMALLLVPLWLVYSFTFRRWWLMHRRERKVNNNNADDGGETV